MTSLHSAEIDWIVALQSLGDPGRILSVLLHVSYTPVLFLAPVVYLCISRQLGGALYLLTAINSCAIWILKTGLHLPRPYWLDPRVQKLDRAGSYGMPSGHVQASTCVWLFLAHSVRDIRAWAAAFLLIAVVGFSRVYYGVHFFSDVLGGFLGGAFLLGGFLWSRTRFSRRLAKLQFSQQIGAVTMAAIGLVALAAGAASLSPLPELDDISRFFHLNAKQLAGFAGPAGKLFGTGCALAAAHRWTRFTVQGPLWERGLRCAFVFSGLELSSVLWNAVPVPQQKLLWVLLMFCRSAWTPAWILFLAPLVLMGAGMLRTDEELTDSFHIEVKAACH
jgi:membrane-associated phospholipid phosphatase